MILTKKLFFHFTLLLTLVTPFNFLPLLSISGLQAQAATTSAKTLNLNIKNLDKKIVKMAMTAYNKAAAKGKIKQNVITIIDYSKPSTEKRMWVIDLTKQKVLYNLHVAHGKNSGANKSTKFSNASGSKASSLGVFITAETYQGKNGYSLRLDGLEKGVNDKARQRAVVIHGANYANASFIKRAGRLGRSWGCPAIAKKISKPVINTIKNGSLVFAYYPDSKWLRSSQYI